MSFIKEKWNMICMALYGVSALCLLFPAFSVGAYGFSLGINAFSLLFGESFWRSVVVPGPHRRPCFLHRNPRPKKLSVSYDSVHRWHCVDFCRQRLGWRQL